MATMEEKLVQGVSAWLDFPVESWPDIGGVGGPANAWVRLQFNSTDNTHHFSVVFTFSERERKVKSWKFNVIVWKDVGVEGMRYEQDIYLTAKGMGKLPASMKDYLRECLSKVHKYYRSGSNAGPRKSWMPNYDD